LCRVQVNSEQVGLESLVEAGERLSQETSGFLHMRSFSSFHTSLLHSLFLCIFLRVMQDGKSHGDELSETLTACGSSSASSSSASSSASSAAPPAPPAAKVSSDERKKRWEAGQADYMGDDSFVHIERKLDSFLK